VLELAPKLAAFHTNGPRQYFVPAFRYVALDVDGHHAMIESLLTKVSMAIRAITDACPDDEPFQSPEFLRPKSLHVTTCFLGSTIGDAQRKVLAASKSSLSLNGLVSIFLFVMLGFQARQAFNACPRHYRNTIWSIQDQAVQLWEFLWTQACLRKCDL